MVSTRLLDWDSNLTLIFAYAVLADVLGQLRDEGEFSCPRSELGKLMEASQKVLRWVNFALVDEGRERRNDVAHRRMDFPREECRRYIKAIQQELIAWKILPA